ncbi:hypothetical protein HMPREF0758_4903 [Serratia odorifera DSM 4582]|uniref:Uncharacterized protein n=1 Tax=Serratia odorifera DSM 4582 TaxID=667129 RepID=D4E9Q3_SEROD|nr:hypothetical protein HMPREF0758_4903 [Serratia odorifera DSM 4582]
MHQQHLNGAPAFYCIHLVRVMSQIMKHFSFNLFTIGYFLTVICTKTIFIM